MIIGHIEREEGGFQLLREFLGVCCKMRRRFFS